MIFAFLNMFSSRKCLFTFAYHYSMTLLAFYSLTNRSLPPVVNFFIQLPIKFLTVPSKRSPVPGHVI